MGNTEKKIRVASTVQLYTSALKKMMGIAQAVEIQEGRGDKLPDGRLQFWQLFNYKTEYHYRIWEKEEFEAVILDRLLSGGTKKHSLAALNWVIKGIKLWLSSQEARDHFMKNRLVSQKHLPNVDMMVVVDHEIEHQRSKLVNILDNTQKSNLNGLFNDQIQAAKKRKDDFEALFQPAEKPDISGAITKYLRSPAVSKLYEDMQRWANDSKKIPSKGEVIYMTKGLSKVMIVQSGNRPNDAFGKGFTHGGLAKACRSAPTIFPYKLVNASKANCASDKDLRLPVGKGLLVREDPYNADPNDEEDPRNQLDGSCRNASRADVSR